MINMAPKTLGNRNGKKLHSMGISRDKLVKFQARRPGYN